MTVSELLGVRLKDNIAVVGCGGKTSLIRLLAAQNCGGKVLVAPTTQMYPMPSGEVMVLKDMEACVSHQPQQGIQQMGILDASTGKLCSLPLAVLQGIAEGFDLTLLEADGSAGKPMKGWGEHEPVIPSFCTYTVGVCTVSAAGLTLTPDYVHRMDCFARLTGLREGDVVGIPALVDMVCSSTGMFWNAQGRRALVVNQVESKWEQAEELLGLVSKKKPSYFDNLIYGSVRQNEWRRYVSV